MSEDGTEIRAGEGTGRAGCQGDPPRRPAAIFGGGEDPHCSVRSGRRGQYRQLCRREGIVQNLYHRCRRNFLEAGKKYPAGDTARAATLDEVKELRREASPHFSNG